MLLRDLCGNAPAEHRRRQSQNRELEAENKENLEKKAQTDADLKKHQEDRKEAKETMAKATALRKKEAAAYAKFSADTTANIHALDGAIVAIERGMGKTKWDWEDDHGSERPDKIVEIHGSRPGLLSCKVPPLAWSATLSWTLR